MSHPILPKRLAFFLGVLATLSLSVACVGEKIVVCDAGATAACFCDDGRSGAQTCSGSGKGFEPCRCRGSAADTLGDDTSSTGDAGQDASPDVPTDTTQEVCVPAPLSAGTFEAQEASDHKVIVLSYEAGSEILSLELYFDPQYNFPREAGTFEFTGQNYQDCGGCSLLRTGCATAGDGRACATALLVQSGTLELTDVGQNATAPRLSGELRDMVYREVTLGPAAKSTLVAGGAQRCFDNLSFDVAITMP